MRHWIQQSRQDPPRLLPRLRRYDLRAHAGSMPGMRDDSYSRPASFAKRLKSKVFAGPVLFHGPINGMSIPLLERDCYDVPDGY